jgi:hypothetical protein
MLRDSSSLSKFHASDISQGKFLTAKRCINNNLMINKMRAEITIPA